MNDDNLQISYSVKEVLERIEGKVDGFLKALAFKADSALVQSMADRLDKAEDGIAELRHKLQAADQHSQWRTEWRRWLVPTILAAGLLAATAASLFHH